MQIIKLSTELYFNIKIIFSQKKVMSQILKKKMDLN